MLIRREARGRSLTVAQGAMFALDLRSSSAVSNPISVVLAGAFLGLIMKALLGCGGDTSQRQHTFATVEDVVVSWRMQLVIGDHDGFAGQLFRSGHAA